MKRDDDGNVVNVALNRTDLDGDEGYLAQRLPSWHIREEIRAAP